MISIWEKESFYAPQDVMIAGSGLVGLWSAFYLKKNQPHLKITILDRGFIPTGASTRNAGFACFGSLSELVADRNKMGDDKMLQLVAMRYKGLDRIQKYFSKKDIDFDLCGGYELYDSEDTITTQQLDENIVSINTLLKNITGLKNTFKRADETITSFGFARTRHMVKNNLEGYLHSGKLVQCLLQRVQRMGVQILNGLTIQKWEAKKFGYDIIVQPAGLSTNQPIHLSTHKLLICTNAFVKDLLPEADVVPARGQVLLTTPVKKLPFKGTFHSEEGYYYFRNLGDKVLLGGARHKAFEQETTADMQTSDLIQTALEQYLNDIILPNHHGQYRIEYRWSGIMAMGSEKMPVVKKLQQNMYCAVRMSGMGVALAPIVGQNVAELILEEL